MASEREMRERGSPELVAMLDLHKQTMERLYGAYYAYVAHLADGDGPSAALAKVQRLFMDRPNPPKA